MIKRRKSKVPPPPLECPLNRCMRLLGGAWTAHVIWYLREGERCFTELQSDIGRVSAKMLATASASWKLKGSSSGTTRRTSPPSVWYSLTPAGQELCEALVNVVDVAQRVKPTQVVSPVDSSQRNSGAPELR